jgi:hypothetical protein
MGHDAIFYGPGVVAEKVHGLRLKAVWLETSSCQRASDPGVCWHVQWLNLLRWSMGYVREAQRGPTNSKQSETLVA